MSLKASPHPAEHKSKKKEDLKLKPKLQSGLNKFARLPLIWLAIPLSPLLTLYLSLLSADAPAGSMEHKDR